ncbi:STAS/SEC14 domain-containing protein [Litoribrevibacter albus]|uniref:STAS/SEC14 domain-containing protein n=1 Tax=Litoribrevibacter albus TaxID=1473156 RepID=A0AA37SCV8_9GAMM|nr:STAS/SEC14 domain-containing protein [Litoribrevibacter albus]GLQ32151.1 STAS/SEC14 domain-containing protein [Litoribrevibacter albus]
MNTIRHGMSIGVERIEDEILFTLKVQGKLTHQDYQHIVPMLESAIKGIDHPHINFYVDATELEGWELRAAWDDLKLGLSHGNEFAKIAIYGNKKWQEYAAKIGTWFISGEARFFESMDEALSWLREEKQPLW